MPLGAAKSAQLRRIVAGEEPMLFGSLYKLPSSDSTPVDSPVTSGTALASAFFHRSAFLIHSSLCGSPCHEWGTGHRGMREEDMSADNDLRLKVDAVTHCALVSHARAHGIEKFDVARDVLAKWAASQVHEARMLASCLRAKGEVGVAEGIARAAQGIAGQPGESPLDWET